MRLIVSIIGICLLLSINVSGQVAQKNGLLIKSKSVTYTRKGSDIDDWKRRFYVRYPILLGGASASARNNILSTIDYWRAFEISREENLSGEDQSLVSFDYRVLYNAHEIFDVAITAETVGAYPTNDTRYYVFDIRSGSQVTYPDVFNESSLSSLLLKIGQAIKRELAAHPNAREEYNELHSDSYNDPPPINKLQFKDLAGFSISNRGVTFIYDYQFPHVALALQPPGKFFFSWNQLKPFIRRDSLLARFIR
jgi:hypothetical protein